MPLIYPVDRPYHLDETEPSAPSGGPHLKKQKYCSFIVLLLNSVFTSSCKIPKSRQPHISIMSGSRHLQSFEICGPIQVLRNALVYRKCVTRCFFCGTVDELWRFPSENLPKRPISGMGTFGVYCQNNIFSGQCIFRTKILSNFISPPCGFTSPPCGFRSPPCGFRSPPCGFRSPLCGLEARRVDLEARRVDLGSKFGEFLSEFGDFF